jgi:hypothetical protein
VLRIQERQAVWKILEQRVRSIAVKLALGHSTNFNTGAASAWESELLFKSGGLFCSSFLNNARIEQACPSIVEALEQRRSTRHHLAISVVHLVHVAVSGKKTNVLHVGVEKRCGIFERNELDLFVANRAVRMAGTAQKSCPELSRS